MDSLGAGMYNYFTAIAKAVYGRFSNTFTNWDFVVEINFNKMYLH